MKTGVIDVGGGLRGIYADGENPMELWVVATDAVTLVGWIP